ncbi:MAG: RdgB/HAM1 family non-canonical purine NTP pyrophosphatase [Alistipes sp.]|nr:RdgB/HAM1 family non-canonical purine NTP pyrophosphatase [Candidatus Alistipes equi]
MTHQIIFATNNRNKLEEVQAILPISQKLLTLQEAGITEEIVEDGTTLEENALIKARYVYKKTGKNCFADDTGLEVDALDGAPGVYSARFASAGHDFEANKKLLLEKLLGVENRKARFRTVIALIMDGQEYLFEGIINGTITCEEHGEGGFGYDPLFRPEGFDKTFAQMTAEQKNGISHRGRAVSKLVDFLNR